MIKTFADDATADVFSGIDSKAARKFPRQLWPVIRKRLFAVDAARTLEDLAVVGGHRFKILKGDLAGRCSIRVNDQYRITFLFTKGDADDVCCEDYH